MFRFAEPDYLYLLIIIPVLCVFFGLSRLHRKKALQEFGNTQLLKELMPNVSNYRPWIKFFILQLALVFLITGLAQPQFGTKIDKVKKRGIELIIALDVSNSMLAQDIQPNRLERAKQAIDRLIDQLQNDRIGVIVFAGDAYTQLPITNDYASAKLFLSSIHPSMIPVQGTAIGKAINLATSSFSPKADKNKALIIITDGENHEDDAVAAAKDAADHKIVIHTLGMGLPEGAPIPYDRGNGVIDYRRDKDGKVVVSKLDENMLKEIAAAGKGLYVRANNSQIGLEALFDQINKMEKKQMEASMYSEYNDQYQYLIGLGLLFLFIEYMVLERKNRFLKNFKLFSVK
ncbi:MAG: VWA domain-containing protein [Bacteroidota bacterium]|nr:VWA domain-containing protein [Bacteroidota bacterium]MDP4205210.1 VWA domain-containing protein [Bacteroidota bacterium]